MRGSFAEEVEASVERIHRAPGPWDEPLPLGKLLRTPPPPVRWLAHERMPVGRGVLLAAVGGSSKTTMLYHLAIGAVLGRVPWGWQINTTGRAVLVLTEDTAEEAHRTTHALAQGLSAEEQERVAREVLIYPRAGMDTLLLSIGESRELVETGLLQALEEKIRALGNVVFVGLDPALSLTAGDELDQGHQRRLGKMADDLAVRTGATVVLVSHATKGSLRDEEITSHSSRGGGAITDAVRAEYALRNMTATEARRAGIDDLEERRRHVQLVATKGNRLPPAAFVPLWLRRGEHGLLAPADIDLTRTDIPRPTTRDVEALDILRELSATEATRLTEWRAACVKAGIVTGKSEAAAEKAMQRVVSRLSAAGLIERGFGRGIWAPAPEDERTWS